MTHAHKARNLIFMEWAQWKNSKSVEVSACRYTRKRSPAHIYSICGRFELRRCGFQGLQVRVWAFVTVHASPGATAGLWQQPLQISHSCVTNSWPRNSAEASYLQTHPHIHTTCELSESTPLSNTEAVKWDYNSECSRLLAPSTLTICPPSSISVILLLAWLQSLREHTSAAEVDALWGANTQRKYTLKGMLKNIIYIHNLQMLNVHISVLPK